MYAILPLAALLFSTFAQAEGLFVVAHSQVQANSISIDELTSIYLIQKSTWNDGVPVVPVNREADSGTREEFSKKVFNRSPRELADYWNRLRFQGKLPPLVQTSDQAVVGFVSKVPGAIGYISGLQAPTGVKVLAKLP